MPGRGSSGDKALREGNTRTTWRPCFFLCDLCVEAFGFFGEGWGAQLAFAFNVLTAGSTNVSSIGTGLRNR
jgi:hypothetical protein